MYTFSLAPILSILIQVIIAQIYDLEDLICNIVISIIISIIILRMINRI